MQSTSRLANVFSFTFATAALAGLCLGQVKAQAPAGSKPDPEAAPAADARIEGLPTFLLPVPGGQVELGLTAPQLTRAACEAAFPSRPDVAVKTSRTAVETSLRRSLPALGRELVDIEPFLLARWPVKNSEYEIFVARSRQPGSGMKPVKPPYHWWAVGCPEDYNKRLPEINRRFPGNERGPRLFWAQEGAELPYKLVDRDGNSIAEHPLSNVSFIDANEFAAALGMRLPTEAEWVRAARGDSSKIWPWGDPNNPDKDVYEGTQSLKEIQLYSPRDKAPKPVGTVAAATGPFGHVDMFGAIWQLVTGPGLNPVNGNEVFADEFKALQKDKVGSLVEAPPSWRSDKVIAKGGSYLSGDDPIQLLIDQRAPMFADDVLDGLGFRLAKSLRPGYDTLYSRLQGIFNRGRFQPEQEIDLSGQVGAERYELAANGFPTQYQTVSFAPVNWLSTEKRTNLRKLLEESQGRALVLGALVTTEPVLGAELKDTIFTVLYRTDGISKELTAALKKGYKEVQADLKEAERRAKRKGKSDEEEEDAKDDDRRDNDWEKVIRRFGLTRKDLEPKGSDKLDYIRIDGVKVPTDTPVFLLHGNEGKIVAAIRAPKIPPKAGKAFPSTIELQDNGEGKMLARIRIAVPLSIDNSDRVIDLNFDLALDCPPPTPEKPWRLPE